MRYQTSVTVTVDGPTESDARMFTESLVARAQREYSTRTWYGSGNAEFAIGETTEAPEPVRNTYTVSLTDAEHRRAVAQYGNILVPVPVTEATA